MPTPEEISESVKEIFHKTLKVDPAKIQPGTNLKDDLNLDSLDMIEVVYEVEDHFDVQIPEESIKDIQTFQQVIDGLSAAIAAKG
jgi:acyl carrier protein